MITNITDKERELQAKLKQYEAVMRQALEALEQWNAPSYKRHNAITALREALHQSAINSSGYLQHSVHIIESKLKEKNS